jgi:rhodanese-related sulfurtransferase
LAHIGLQPVAAAVEPAATRTATMRLATFDDLAIEWTDAIGVIDVRRREEWDAGHLDGAVHIPVHRLPHALAEIPRNRQLWLHCAAGYRAALGASVLRRAGFDAVAVDDNWAAAARAGLTVSAG